ncbi:MAG TPA: SpoIIE family protein phosphatase, partial [Candidatus Berkiella sp.]|nr:SpoIIE family protein phosphatase [Candidatus Berkiella sp.]
FTHRVIPSLYLSGDFIDYFEINQDKIIFYIADVSGHGASSAFITILLKSFIEKIVLNYQMGYDDNVLHPEKVLKLLSDEILKVKLGKYLTMI